MLMTKATCKVYMHYVTLRNVKKKKKRQLTENTIHSLNIFLTYVYITNIWEEIISMNLCYKPRERLIELGKSIRGSSLSIMAHLFIY